MERIIMLFIGLAFITVGGNAQFFIEGSVGFDNYENENEYSNQKSF